MKLGKLFLALIVAFVGLSFVHYAMAQGLPPVPESVDWSIAKGPWGWASAIIVAVVQILNKFVPDLNWKRSLVALLSALYGIVANVVASGSANWVTGLVTALFTMGGAVLLYESGKGLVKAFQGQK